MSWSRCWASCPNGHLGVSDGDPPKILQRNPNSIPTHHNSLQISRVSSSPFTAELPFQHRPKRPGLSAGGSCEEAGSSAVLNAPIGRFEDFPPPRRSSFQEHGAPRSPSKLVVGGGASRQRSCAPPSTSTSLPLGVDDPSSSYAEVLRRGLRPPLPSRMSSCSPAASSRRRKVRFHSYTAVTSFQIGSPHVSWALASCGPLLGSFSPTSSQVSFQQLMPRRAFPIPDLPHNLPPDSLTSLAAEKGSSAVLPTASTAEDLVCSQQSHQCQEFPAQGVPSETPWLEVRRKEWWRRERNSLITQPPSATSGADVGVREEAVDDDWFRDDGREFKAGTAEPAGLVGGVRAEHWQRNWSKQPASSVKGHYQQQQHSSSLLPSKRHCSGLAAAVPALVVCSILLPLVFSASTVPVRMPCRRISKFQCALLSLQCLLLCSCRPWFGGALPHRHQLRKILLLPPSL
jgi:hypothetical protein